MRNDTQQPLKCNTPGCNGEVWLRPKPSFRHYHFCAKCRSNHSYDALVVQVKHEKSIKEVIMDARMFKNACHMADYIGVSFVTLYHWISKYFGMSFQDFRRKYICKSDSCYVLNIYQSSYNRQDYILKKIRDKRYCACVFALEDHIMTNAPLAIVSNILAGKPCIGKVSDDVFTLLPNPIYFDDGICPIYQFSETLVVC